MTIRRVVGLLHWLYLPKLEIGRQSVTVLSPGSERKAAALIEFAIHPAALIMLLYGFGPSPGPTTFRTPWSTLHGKQLGMALSHRTQPILRLLPG
jgi:hypothetical protein